MTPEQYTEEHDATTRSNAKIIWAEIEPLARDTFGLTHANDLAVVRAGCDDEARALGMLYRIFMPVFESCDVDDTPRDTLELLIDALRTLMMTYHVRLTTYVNPSLAGDHAAPSKGQ